MSRNLISIFVLQICSKTLLDWALQQTSAEAGHSSPTKNVSCQNFSDSDSRRRPSLGLQFGQWPTRGNHVVKWRRAVPLLFNPGRAKVEICQLAVATSYSEQKCNRNKAQQRLLRFHLFIFRFTISSNSIFQWYCT